MLENSLDSIVRLRTMTAAGVYVCITRQCPMECSHCYTDSHPNAKGNVNERHLLAFVRSFCSGEAPKWILFSGGEPLLRADSIRKSALICRKVGTKVYVNTGAYFAAKRNIPEKIIRCISQIDHLSISCDIHHEKFVKLEDTINFIDWFIDEFPEKGISVQLCESPQDDGYTLRAKDQLKCRFGQRVGIAIMSLQPTGRGASLEEASGIQTRVRGCPSSGWPQVTFDGTVLACCTSSHLKQTPPPHLIVGNIEKDGWATVSKRLTERRSLELIKLCGPRWLENRYGNARSAADAPICDICMKLASDIEEKVASDTLVEFGVLPMLREGESRNSAEKISTIFEVVK